MKITFLTYDGLLYPLGKSQILPYLLKLRPHVDEMQIISFEKKEKLNSKDFLDLSKNLSNMNIFWIHHTFTASKFSLFKVIDIANFYKSFIWNCIIFKPTIVHARGHPMAIFACAIKKIFNFKLLFDYRGMWPDEKLSKGTWNLKFATHRVMYKFFKKWELNLLSKSDYLVFLTERVRNHFINSEKPLIKKSSIIPCAADYTLFNFSDYSSEKKFLKSSLSFENNLVLGYLGSIGPLYDFKGYLNLIKVGLENHLSISGLVITNNLEDAEEEISRFDFQKNNPSIKCLTLSREEVPKYLQLFSYLVSFCTISKSIIGASPTKIGEALSLGVPIISNSGVGDIDSIINETKCGILLEDTSIESLQTCINELRNQSFNKDFVRKESQKFFDLNIAFREYLNIYKTLDSDS